MFGTPAPTVRDAAAALARFAPSASVDDVEAFLAACVGRRGGLGLAALANSCEAAGTAFGTIFALDGVARNAAANAANCAKLAALGRCVVSILDAAGRARAADTGDATTPPPPPPAVDAAMLAALAACLDDCHGVARGYARPGWLLRIACNGAMREDFVTLHEAVGEILKSDGLGQLPGGRALPLADYSPLHKPVRRLLKQLGRGSVTDGALAARDPESHAARELAALLEVDPAAVAAEAARIPDTGIDIDAVWRASTPGTLAGVIASALADEDGGGAEGGSDGGGKAVSEDAGDGFMDMFNRYDADKSGAIELPELTAALSDLGLLDGKAPAEAAAIVEGHMRAAGGGPLSPGAFGRWAATLLEGKARQQLRFKMGVQAEEDLRDAFTAFASFGGRGQAAHEMDGRGFAKLCRDAGLIDGERLSTTQVDLIFAKAKAKGARRIGFDAFVDAVAAVAEKKGTALDETVRQIVAAGGPVARATKAAAVRLHDDRSTYTGVYARGGPTAVDEAFDLAAFLDRDRAAAAASSGGGNRSPMVSGAGGGSGAAARSATPSSVSAPRRASLHQTPGSAAPSRRVSGAFASSGGGAAPATADTEPASLRDVFAAFAKLGASDRAASATPGSAGGKPPPRFDTSTSTTPGSAGRAPGAAAMDGVRFAKLCRDAGLVDGKRLTATQVDLIFAKAKAKGARRIGFDEFSAALAMVADAMRAPLADVAAAVGRCGSAGGAVAAAAAGTAQPRGSGGGGGEDDAAPRRRSVNC